MRTREMINAEAGLEHVARDRGLNAQSSIVAKYHRHSGMGMPAQGSKARYAPAPGHKTREVPTQGPKARNVIAQAVGLGCQIKIIFRGLKGRPNNHDHRAQSNKR